MTIGSRPAFLAIGAALLGGALFSLVGVPAGALVGSTIAVTALTASGLKPSVPGGLRNLGFTTIGVTLGAGITPNFVADLQRFPLSLAALTLTIALVMLAGSLLLARLFSTDRTTALLATSPGALSYSLALATDGQKSRGDVRVIAVLQSLRLLIITVILPPVVALIDSIGGAAAAPRPDQATSLGVPASIVLIAGSFLVGIVLERMRVPAAFLLAGVLASGVGHGAGLLEGRPDVFMTFFGFSIAGAVIGSRFSGITPAELKQLLGAGLAVTALSLGISGFMSLATAHLLDLPFGQVWVAFAPGGVEGMSAMALALGYDPAYVAAHHIFRLAVLIMALPLLLRN